MIKDLVQTALLVFDNLEFTSCAMCPRCGGPIQGYDTRTKKFATIMEDGRERVITVRVKRFTCRSCGSLCYADEPFYPGTRIGSPVIDLFTAFATTMPECRAARVIDALGISVDRTTWRNYTGPKFSAIPELDMFGMRLPVSVMMLSTLAVRYGETTPTDPQEVLRACGYPSAISGTASGTSPSPAGQG
jgi:hypothetical protein